MARRYRRYGRSRITKWSGVTEEAISLEHAVGRMYEDKIKHVSGKLVTNGGFVMFEDSEGKAEMEVYHFRLLARAIKKGPIPIEGFDITDIYSSLESEKAMEIGKSIVDELVEKEFLTYHHPIYEPNMSKIGEQVRFNFYLD